MVRGCQKRTVHIRDTGSKYYEEAFFILKPGALEASSETDMIEEALRIADNSLRAASPSKRKRKHKVSSVLYFAAGAAAGALACGAVCLALFI